MLKNQNVQKTQSWNLVGYETFLEYVKVSSVNDPRDLLIIGEELYITFSKVLKKMRTS